MCRQSRRYLCDLTGTLREYRPRPGATASLQPNPTFARVLRGREAATRRPGIVMRRFVSTATASQSRRERFSKIAQNRARVASVRGKLARRNRPDRKPRNDPIRTYLRAVWVGQVKAPGTGAALVKDCTTQPFCLMWNSSYESDRPPRSIEWIERALDRVAPPGG